MPKRSAAQEPPPRAEDQNTSSRANACLRAQITNLVALTTYLEIKSKGTFEVEEQEDAMEALVQKHVGFFMEHEIGYYRHPVIKQLHSDYTFEPNSILKGASAQFLLNKAKEMNRQVKEESPLLYECDSLQPPDYKLKSGRSAEDLLAEYKQKLWMHHKKDPELFKPTLDLYVYSQAMLCLMVLSPLSDYLVGNDLIAIGCHHHYRKLRRDGQTSDETMDWSSATDQGPKRGSRRQVARGVKRTRSSSRDDDDATSSVMLAIRENARRRAALRKRQRRLAKSQRLLEMLKLSLADPNSSAEERARLRKKAYACMLKQLVDAVINRWTPDGQLSSSSSSSESS